MQADLCLVFSIKNKFSRVCIYLKPVLSGRGSFVSYFILISKIIFFYKLSPEQLIYEIKVVFVFG